MSTIERAARRVAKPKDITPKVGVVRPSTNGKHGTNGHSDIAGAMDLGDDEPTGGKRIIDMTSREMEVACNAAPAGTAIAELPVRDIGVSDLRRHPKNRTPTPAAVAERAASMKADGQFEPLLVWQAPGLDDGEYEIISGETRWLAAKELGWETVRCKVLPHISSAKALELLVSLNAQRSDLNPIEKARNIAALCESIEKGGAGLTRDQAAKVQGLETGAAASNLVRLLELTDEWQDRVADGTLPQSIARLLTPYAASARVMAALDADWTKCNGPKSKPYDRECWETREQAEGTIESIVEGATRPIDAKIKHHHGYGQWGELYGVYPRLFELTDEVREQLDVVALPVGEKGKLVEVATNVELWDKLQRPALKAHKAKESKGKASASAADGQSKKPKSLSPAEAKAAAKEKAEQLEKRIAGWRSNWLKSLIAPRLAKCVTQSTRAIFALLLNNQGDELTEGLNEVIGSFRDDPYAAIAATSTRGPCADLFAKTLCVVLAKEDRDPRYPTLEFEFVDALAADVGIDLAEAWAELQRSDRDRFETFLLLHTGEQLDAQAAEWKFFIPDGKPKSVKIDMLKGTAARFALPKSIAPLPKPKAAAPAKAAKAKRGGK